MGCKLTYAIHPSNTYHRSYFKPRFPSSVSNRNFLSYHTPLLTPNACLCVVWLQDPECICKDTPEGRKEKDRIDQELKSRLKKDKEVKTGPKKKNEGEKKGTKRKADEEEEENMEQVTTTH